MIINAIFSIVMAIVTNIDFNVNLKRILFGIVYCLSGITSNLYSTCVVLGKYKCY